MAEDKKDIILSIRGMSKSFGRNKVLKHIDLDVKKGSIMGLMGENGAGKSTMMKCLFGTYQKDEGTIILDGKEINFTGPKDALENGVAMVHQELNQCLERNVIDNLFLGRYPKNSLGVVDEGRMKKEASDLFRKLGITVNLSQPMKKMSVSKRQMCEIAKAISYNSKVIVLDEPTSSLTAPEVEKLFKLMRDLKARGVGIIFVTHFLDQVYEVCDKITVLRDGKLVGQYEIKDLPRVQLVAKMLGKELDDMSSIRDDDKVYHGTDASENVLEAEQLVSNAGIKPFDFYIKKGEVNGFTGLLGSGRSECVRAIFGADHVSGGTVKMKGKKVKITRPIDAMRHGIAYLPEDRKVDGIVGDLSVRENIILAQQVLRGFFKPFSKAEANKIAEEYIKLLDIKTASADTPIKSLSGGNQQKVILARWLFTHPEYLILDEPTRGIDVGTKIDIQKLVLDLASEGMSVTFISSETDEMLRTCSRLIVMRDRKVVGELTGKDLTQAKIMSTIAGGDME